MRTKLAKEMSPSSTALAAPISTIARFRYLMASSPCAFLILGAPNSVGPSTLVSSLPQYFQAAAKLADVECQ